MIAFSVCLPMRLWIKNEVVFSQAMKNMISCLHVYLLGRSHCDCFMLSLRGVFTKVTQYKMANNIPF